MPALASRTPENIAPLAGFTHLKGALAIARCFGVSRRTVVQWTLEGAPISMVGRKYQASYERLSRWLEERYPACASRA